FIFNLAISILFFQGCERSPKAEVKKAKIDDIEIAYYTMGSGEPLIMIMGFRGTMAIWDPALLDILSKKYKLILFDNRGVGFSTDTESNTLTISQIPDATPKFINILVYEHAHSLH